MEGPAGFVTRSDGRRRLLVEATLAESVEGLDLLSPDTWQRLSGAPPGRAGRAPTALFELPDGRRLLVRRLLRGGLAGPLLGSVLFGSARPVSELAVTAELRRRGAPVPRPAFAWLERRFGPVFRAAVATGFEEGAVDALEFLEERPSGPRLQRAALAAGRAVRRLHDAGGRHRDLHVKNLLVRETEQRAECIIVDLDRATLEPHVSPSQRMSELMRLFRSLVKRRVAERVGR
ncbi:MAG: lipopolysaccharide kinase InaA family protein, partial [Myxococcota bacterium]